VMPSLRKTSSKEPLNLLSRSRIRNRVWSSRPVRLRLRAWWVIQAPVGLVVAPAMWDAPAFELDEEEDVVRRRLSVSTVKSRRQGCSLPVDGGTGSSSGRSAAAPVRVRRRAGSAGRCWARPGFRASGVLRRFAGSPSAGSRAPTLGQADGLAAQAAAVLAGALAVSICGGRVRGASARASAASPAAPCDDPAEAAARALRGRPDQRAAAAAGTAGGGVRRVRGAMRAVRLRGRTGRA
jgi:hypothetical protein